jgi:hypothetical protein
VHIPLRPGFKAAFDEFGRPAAEHYLFAEQIGFGFLVKSVSLMPPRPAPFATAYERAKSRAMPHLPWAMAIKCGAPYRARKCRAGNGLVPLAGS